MVPLGGNGHYLFVFGFSVHSLGIRTDREKGGEREIPNTQYTKENSQKEKYAVS